MRLLGLGILVLAFSALTSGAALAQAPGNIEDSPDLVDLDVVIDCDSFTVLADYIGLNGTDRILNVHRDDDNTTAPVASFDLENGPDANIVVLTGSLPADFGGFVRLYNDGAIDNGDPQNPNEFQQDNFSVDADNTCDGSITVVVDTNPEDGDPSFDYDGDLGDFDLEDNAGDRSIVFNNLDPGNYRIEQNETSGWDLVDIDCNHSQVSTDVSDGEVIVDLDAGEDITCVFTNEEDDETAPTPVPTVAPVPTPQVIFVPLPAPVVQPQPQVQVIERVVEKPVVVQQKPAVVRPPSTGDGGLVVD